MNSMDIREYLRKETGKACIEYQVVDLGLLDRIDAILEELASEYESGKLIDRDMFGEPEEVQQPHVAAANMLRGEIAALAKREYFSQMGREDALTICRGLWTLESVKGASWTVQADIVGCERVSLECFLQDYNAMHPDDPIKYSLPVFEN